MNLFLTCWLTRLNSALSFLRVGPGIYSNALVPQDGGIKSHLFGARFLGFESKSSLFMYDLLTITHTQHLLTGQGILFLLYSPLQTLNLYLGDVWLLSDF